MTEASPTRRWYRLTPDRLVLLLLVVECLLWLSDRLGWPAWHKGYAVLDSPTWHKGYAVLTCMAVVGVGMIAMLGWFLVALIFRFRFQFGIGTLLILTVAVAFPFSWLAAFANKAEKHRHAVAAIYKQDGRLAFTELRNPLPPPPDWRERLSEHFFPDVDDVVIFRGLQLTNDTLRPVENLLGVRELDLDGSRDTDAGLAAIRGLTQLEVLSLSYSQVTDDGIACLVGLPRLHELRLDRTSVTDAGLEKIGRLTELQWLALGETKITDAGLECLKKMTELRWLGLGSTKVTDAGVKKLQQALPNCEITR